MPVPAVVEAPFWFSWNIQPPFADRYTVCAIVELVGDGRRIVKESSGENGKPAKARLVEFDVKVIQGIGIAPKTVRRCLAPDAPPHAATTGSKRFLLLGWPSDDAGRLQIDWAYVAVGGPGRKQVDVGVKSATLFVGVLVPTKQPDVVSASSVCGRAYLNLAECLTRGTDLSAIRCITSQWAQFGWGQAFEVVDGVPAHDWLAQVVGPKLEAVTPRNPVERLRFGGLVADWFRPMTTMDYLRSLSALLKELADKRYSPTDGDRPSDLSFLAHVNLCTGLSADDIVAIGMSDPDLRFLALDGRMATPSLESQKKMLTLLDDQDPNIRATAYRRYATWYGLGQWSLDSSVTWSPTENHEFIPNEAEMHAYWLNKLGGPPRP